MTSFRPISEDEFCRLQHSCGGRRAARERAFFAFLYGTGLQPSQILRLKFSDVYQDRWVCKRLVASKTNGLATWLKGRRVVLGSRLETAIEGWVIQVAREDLYSPWRPLFLSDTNPDRAATPLHFWRHFRRAAERAGLDGRVGLPSLRASFGMRYLRRSNYGFKKLRTAMGFDCLRNARRAYRRIALTAREHSRRANSANAEFGGG
jgi:integrase